MEEYETRSKRKLSLFQLEKDRLQRVNSLELRADELRTDCCSSTKLAVYMPVARQGERKDIQGLSDCQSQ
jgi:hypothetical protein